MLEFAAALTGAGVIATCAPSRQPGDQLLMLAGKLLSSDLLSSRESRNDATAPKPGEVFAHRNQPVNKRGVDQRLPDIVTGQLAAFAREAHSCVWHEEDLGFAVGLGRHVDQLSLLRHPDSVGLRVQEDAWPLPDDPSQLDSASVLFDLRLYVPEALTGLGPRLRPDRHIRRTPRAESVPAEITDLRTDCLGRRLHSIGDHTRIPATRSLGRPQIEPLGRTWRVDLRA